MKTFILFISFFLVVQLNAQTWKWAKHIGGSDLDHGHGIVCDDSGNIYITGYFSGTADFNDTSLTSIGKQDIFLAKYNQDGNLLWVRQAGGSNQNNWSLGIALDIKNNIVITGSFKGICSFDTIVLTSSGDRDVFIAKYNSSGEIIWVKKAGGPNWDMANSIAIDNSENILITGFFDQVISFDSVTLNGKGGYEDIFIAKYDSNAKIIWAKQASGKNFDVGNSISADKLGNVFITGSFRDTIEFDTVTLISYGYTDIFIAKYNQTGNLVWVRQAGSTSNTGDQGNSICADSIGNTYITGSFSNPAYFGNTWVNSVGEGDIFIAKYDPSGNLSWINVTGGKADDGGFAICLDKFGYCYITGGYQSSGVNFETTILPWRGSLDIFVAKYDSDGNFYWANCAGGSWVDWAKGITTDFSGNIYIIGTIENKAVFGNDTLSYYGASDVFFAKLNNGDNGIEPGTPGNTILAYPNPFSTFTKLSFQTKGSEKFTLSIYNSMGQIIKQEDFFRSPILIYKQNLNPGLYFFQVKNSAGIAGQGKLIIE